MFPMTDLKCPFTNLQAAGACGCRNAREVVRRGGVEHDCTDGAAHGACMDLTTRFKAVGLAALGHEDDLTLTPRSVYDRVLLGGLAGLRRAVDPSDHAWETRDIRTVVEAAAARHPDLTAVPAAELVPAMEACEPARRRRRRR